MTSTDTTRQKLMNSMRKTKAAASDKASGTSKAVSVERPKVGAKETASKARMPRPEARQASADPYQGGRRVWPD